LAQIERENGFRAAQLAIHPIRFVMSNTGNAAATVGQDEMGVPLDPGRFAPVALISHFNASPSDFGPRDLAKAMGGPSQQDGLIHTPSGKQNFRGIPFLLGAEGSMAIELDLPNGLSIEIQATPVRYEKRDEGYLIGARISRMSDRDRGLFEEYLGELTAS